MANRLAAAPPAAAARVHKSGHSKTRGPPVSAQRYPLAWPAGWPRSRATGGMRSGNFKVDFDKAVRELAHEIDLLGGLYPVLSSNLELRLDGQPRRDKGEPADRGVAVYFELKGQQKVFACDTFTTVRDNIRAIGLTIASLRSIERYGATAMLERALHALDALPAPTNCWQLLGVKPGAGEEAIRIAYREKAKTIHPDQGGNTDAMAELNAARDRALKGEAA